MFFSSPTKKHVVVVACVVLCIVIVISLALLLASLMQRENAGAQNPWIYGILVTGKDDARMQAAAVSVANFFAQSYPYKRLIIINHHPTVRLANTHAPANHAILEVPVDKKKHGLMLGDLRNIALNMVPLGARWITWDDDDWRDLDFLRHMHRAMERAAADVVLFTQRYEYDARSRFAWRTELTIGFVHALCRCDHRIRYLRKDTMEDVHLRQRFQELGLRTHRIVNNDPTWYVRLVHKNNTSALVSAEGKTTLRAPDAVWKEHAASASETAKIEKIILVYNKFLGLPQSS